MDISVVIPVFNEEDNIESAMREVHAVLTRMGSSFEIIFVDDGSTDNTRGRIQETASKYPEVQSLFLARNYGQSTAIQGGFDAAAGDIIVTMDGDLQNDPADIPKLIGIMEEQNVDLVSGWRRDRKDGPFRTALSKLANALISHVTGVRLHDYGCTLKAYRSDIVRQVKVVGELHRFIPALMAEVGATFREVDVNHRPRVSGNSKYGVDRTFRVGLDLLLIIFLRRYLQRPLHFFGAIGVIMGASGFAICGYLAFLKLAFGEDIGGRPLLLLGFFLLISAVMLVVQGLIGEIVVRLLHQSADRPQYRLRLSRKLAVESAGPPEKAEAGSTGC